MFEPLCAIEIELKVWDRDTRGLSKALWVHRQAAFPILYLATWAMKSLSLTTF